MNNILIFSPTPSHPQNAGNRIRIYNLAKQLQKNGNKIIFVYYTQEGLENQQKVLMEKEWDQCIFIKKEKHYISTYVDYYAIDDWYDKSLGLQIQKIVLNNKIDIVLCVYIFQSKILDFIPSSILKIIDTQDKFSNRHKMLEKAGLKPDFFYTTEVEESIALNRPDIIMAIQNEEADFFSSISKQRVEILGHIDQERFFPKKFPIIEAKAKVNIGFIGSTNTMNTVSLKLFLEKFIQLDEKYTNQVNIKIAGTICTKVVIEHDSIEYIGFVEHLKEFYENIDLIINPLIIGTGLKIKTVEALSYGKPILSTQIGFEGVPSTSQFHNCESVDDMLVELLIILEDKSKHLQEMKKISENIFTDMINRNNNQINTIFAKKESKNILIITHINFWERDLGSRNRLFDMIMYLKEYMSIVIIYINPRAKYDDDKIELLGLSKNVFFIEDIQTSVNVSVEELHSFQKAHKVLEPFINIEHYRKLGAFIKNYQFDKVIIEYIHLSYFLPLFKNIDCYLDSHDIMHKRNEIFKKNNETHWIDISKEEEFTLFKEYKYVLSIQKNEHSFLLANDISTILVPYSFKVNSSNSSANTKSIIFIGGNNLANQNSIIWFINNIWDLFVTSDYALEIYGTVCDAIKNNPNKKIFTKGKIDDLDELYTQKAAIAINPVTLGGGLKIKNVEAIASGIPLLTTTQGAFGLEDGINEAFLVADTIEEWKSKLLALIISQELRTQLSINAIKYTKDNFERDVCYKELTQLLIENKDVIDENK